MRFLPHITQHMRKGIVYWYIMERPLGRAIVPRYIPDTFIIQEDVFYPHSTKHKEQTAQNMDFISF